MALKTGFQIYKSFHFMKSEIIIRSIPNADISNIVIKFKEKLNDVKVLSERDACEILSFPNRTFDKFPTYVLKSIIDESFNSIKLKNFENSISFYNTILISYINNNIHIDLTHILNEMKENNVQYNDHTYGILIKLFSQRGQMDIVKTLIDELNSQNKTLELISHCNIIMGYIISGKPEISKIYMEKNNIDRNELSVLIAHANAYSSVGDYISLMNIMEELKAKNLAMSVKNIVYIYIHLLKAGVSDIEREKFIDLRNNPNLIWKLIFLLNRHGYFNKSLEIFIKFKDGLINAKLLDDLIISFNSSECPIEIYKKFLSAFINNRSKYAAKYIFSNMDFMNARKFVETNINNINDYGLILGLIHKAVNDKSIDHINLIILVGHRNVSISKLNTLYFEILIPILLESEMASDCQEILTLLPNHKRVFLPLIFLYCLSKGQFSEFNTLRINNPSINLINVKMKLKVLATDILNNLSFNEVDQLVIESNKVFVPMLINEILSALITEKIVLSSINNHETGIVDAVRLAETYHVHLRSADKAKLNNSAIEHQELFKSIMTSESSDNG